jgi:Ca-activated chloride channel family protein
MSETPVFFAHPEFANGLWVWALVLLAFILLERRGSDALDRLVGPTLQNRLIDRPSPWRRWTRIGLLGMAGFAMIVALMQPQWGLRFVATPRVGAEIMIALDVSRSMLADDAKPSRLERAKAEISDLLSYLDDDHVGLIAFAGRASVLSPMTPDKSFLRLVLDSAGPHSVTRGGTRLAEPILRAIAGMGEPGPAQRALILITDGEDHDSFALDAARAAAEAGIKIIAIGFGDEGGSQIYLNDARTGARQLLRDADGNAVVSRLDGDLLREIALATDGAFVPAGTGVLDLASIYEAHIAQLTRGQLDDRGRTIRDEAFQFFVLVALLCLVAAVSIASGRGLHAQRVGQLGMTILLLLFIAPQTEAQLEKQSDTAAASAPSDASEDARTKFNRANEVLEKGDAVAATALLRAARRDATDDVPLRYAATFNLGMAAAARADALQNENASEALAALYEAADWFREAAVARPDEPDPRHNLDVTLRRALILSDEISRADEQELDAELEALIEAQRQRVGDAAALLEIVVRSGELGVAEELRSAFRDSATEQRLIISDANALGERVAREREELVAVAQQDRSPEEVLESAQLEGVLLHLDSAIDRMGQTRRQFRQGRAERAYRRGSNALGDLKRARDQLRSPVEQIGILLAEVGRLATSTATLASTGLPGGAALEDAKTPTRPAFLTRESVEADADQIENRVAELAARLALAAQQAPQSQGSPSQDPASTGAAPIDDARRIALQKAVPLVENAATALERGTAAIGEGRYETALVEDVVAGEALAAAQEGFFDLRQLLNTMYTDEQRIANIAGSDEPTVVQERSEQAEYIAELQSKNAARGLRLALLLEQERKTRIAQLEAESQSDDLPPDDASPDPVEQEGRRFDLANELLSLASGAMGEATDALLITAGQASPDWPTVTEAATRAEQHLDAIRTLFFSIAEHVRKLALDQLDLRDRTQDVVALSVTEMPPGVDAELSDLNEPTDSALAKDVSSEEPRGPETLARTRELSGDQRKLESRGGEIADALFVQAEDMAQDSPEGAGPDASAERDRIRQAAEHVASAQLAMRDASESLEAETAPLAPVQDAQTLVLEELNAALLLLSPPPPPEDSNSEQEESEQDEQSGQDESQSQNESQESGDQGAPQSAEAEDAGTESMDDPSQLLQGVRDRDAERRRERDRENQRRRTEAVDKDW